MSTMPNDPFRSQEFSSPSYNRPQDDQVLIPTGAVKPYPILEDGSWDKSEEEPVVARPSLRRRRGVLTMAVVAFTIGSLLIILSSPYRNEFLAPGPLHSSHAQLLAGEGADRCAACHNGSANSSFGWIAHAISGASNETTQSQLCLECHKSNFDEAFALNPHNVDPEKLAQRTARFQNASFITSLSMPPVNGENEIACRSCHREHKSSDDLTAMTDAQCQSCHQSNFHSFESDHSEFTNWPRASQQNIAFDHASHSSKHFPAGGATFDCNRCHLDDAWQNVKTLAPFEQACASCHEQKIVDSGQQGLAIVALPMLDMKAIEGQKLSVGTWPLAATGDFDGELPPAMKLLLSADPNAGPILNARPNSFEFLDLDPANADDVSDAVTLAWSIKRLLIDVSINGQIAIQQRLEIALGRTVQPSQVAGMMDGLQQQDFAAAARRWFPGVGAEIKQKFGDSIEGGLSSKISEEAWLANVPIQETLAENPLAALKNGNHPPSGRVSLDSRQGAMAGEGEAPQRQNPPATAVNFPNTSTQTGWVRDDRSLRIFYRPSGHADPFLKHWIEAVSKTPSANERPAVSAMLESLTKPTSIGNCRYCHTLKRDQDDSLVMNWKEHRRDGSMSQFTSFSHRPHLVQPMLQDCSHCHRLNEAVSNKESFASVDRLDYKSNFHPIEKATCASCHRAGLTDNGCTTCHDYHVGARAIK